MSLITWLPLISNVTNKGLKNCTTTTTGTIAYNAGFLNKALTFNNSAITLNPAPITTNVKEHSFAFWFKTTNASATQCIYNGRTATGAAIAIFFIGGKIRYDDGAQRTFNYSITANTWTHAVITRDTSNICLYINGTLQQTIASTDFTCTTTTASIGMSSTSGTTPSGNAMVGQLNDYRIYDHVLSKKEVKELSKGLTMHMPMDWGGNNNILPDSPVVTNPTENNTELGRTVYVRSTTATGESYIWGGRSDVVEQSTKYTLSAWVWVNEYVKSVEVFWLSTNTTNKKTGTAYDSVTVKSAWTQTPNTWKYVTWTFTTKVDDYTGVIRWDNNGSSVSGTAAILKVYNMKIEKGEKATPFVPHKNDSVYNKKGFGDKFKQECSGFARVITTGGTAIIDSDGNSPRGTGSYFTSGCYVKSDVAFPMHANMPTWTVAFWFKPDIGKTFTSWSDAFRFWINTEAGNNTHFRLETQNTSGNNYCLYYNNSGSSSYGGGALTTITEKKWYHLAFCCDGTTVKQYVNAEQKINHTINSGFKPTGTTGSIQFGDSGMYASYADCRVYSTCLSAADIKELYQIPAQIDKSGKVYCNTLIES